MKPQRWRRSVLPVRARHGTVLGTAAVIGEGLALTARAVAADGAELTLGEWPGVPVVAVETLPGDDVALLVAPGLDGPALRPRGEPVWVGEHGMVPGYPGGYWAVAHSSVRTASVERFTLRGLPGATGAPVLDLAGQMIGLLLPGATCVGPPVLAGFLDQLLGVVG